MSREPTGSTELRRQAQYRDRWTSRDAQTGLVALSEMPTVDELREIELFRDFDDRLLEKLAPDVSIAVWRKGAVLFEEGTYLDLAFYVIAGEIEVFVSAVGGEAGRSRPIFDLSRTTLGPAATPPPREGSETVLMRRAERTAAHEITLLTSMDFDLPAGAAARLGPGEIFGEIGALSGWPQSVTARTAGECRLAQIRVPALRLMRRKSKALGERLDALYRERSLAAQLRTTPLFRDCSDLLVDAIKETVELVHCEPGEVIFREGEPADAVYLVRSGFVKLLERYADGELAVSYLSKGMTFGEAELLIDEVEGWRATGVSVEYSELVRIPDDVFERLLAAQPDLRPGLWQSALERVRESGYARRQIGHSQFLQVALQEGLVQGSSILAIDLETCTRCDDCVKACADTHGGRPRFVREGNRVGSLLIAKSCYHCRDPVCLVGCPTGAIHRAGVGDVVAISEEICIGCGSCSRGCPYDAIVMHETGVSWPGDMVPVGLRGRDRDVASKCDLCVDTGHGPACVSNCPHGCAFRVGSVEELQALLGDRGAEP